MSIENALCAPWRGRRAVTFKDQQTRAAMPRNQSKLAASSGVIAAALDHLRLLLAVDAACWVPDRRSRGLLHRHLWRLRQPTGDAYASGALAVEDRDILPVSSAIGGWRCSFR